MSFKTQKQEGEIMSDIKKETQAKNHPAKGSTISVNPIRDRKDITLIKGMLKDRPMDLGLFTVGINTNLRASDILRLKYAQVKDLKANDEIQIREKKTGKLRLVTFNDNAVSAIQSAIKAGKYDPDDYLFKSQRPNKKAGGAKVWTVSNANAKVKKWCKDIRLKGNYGSHSLRKTWAFHQYKTWSVPIPVLMKALNHSSQAQTLAYIGITEADVKNTFLNNL